MMIEFINDNEFVTLNPDHIVYIRNDEGSAVIKMITNEQFVIDDYNEALSRIRMSNTEVFLDKEAREAADEALTLPALAGSADEE